MQKILITGSIFVGFIGIAVVGWFILNQATDEIKVSTNTASVNKPDPDSHNYIDVDFARKMIVHNQQGIQMTDLAGKRTGNEEIRKLAAHIKEELEDDTEQYVKWLTQWKEAYFNLSDFPEMEGHDMYPTHPGMASLSEVRSLEATDSNTIDELFLQLMITHHEGANKMANDVVFQQMQFRQEVSLKEVTIKRQVEEVQVMKQLQTKGE